MTPVNKDCTLYMFMRCLSLNEQVKEHCSIVKLASFLDLLVLQVNKNWMVGRPGGKEAMVRPGLDLWS